MTLLEKQAKFSLLICDLIIALDGWGFQVTLGEAWRSPETCAIYAKDGRGISGSNHTSRLAIDLNLFWAGKLLENVEDYRTAGNIWKGYSTDKIRCVWGGDFKRVDAYHFSVEHEGIR